MRHFGRFGALLFGMSIATGCANLPGTFKEGPKTLLVWASSDEPSPAPNDVNRNEPDGDKRTKVSISANTNPEEPLVTDRPDFTEASSTVGKGRVQLESGYTYVRDGSDGATTNSHSFPEALLRVGIFADWLELRCGQNFGSTRAGSPDGVFNSARAEDLYLGVKLGLTEQKGVLPESAIVLQSQIPTGSRAFTSGKLLPGLNLLYGWDVIEDRLSFGGSSQSNGAIEDSGHGYVEFAQSLTVGYTLTERLGAYTEWFALFPAGAVDSRVGPQQYLNGGFTYRLSPNIQFDVRAGLGLNRHADDFFAGTGFAVRY